MDPSVLTPVVSPIIKLFVSSASQLISNAMNAEKEIKKLNLYLTVINSVLENAEGWKTNHLAISEWLRKMEDVAYEAMALLDEHAHEINHQKKVSKFFNKFRKLGLGREIMKIKESLDSVGSLVGFVPLLNQDQSSVSASIDNVHASERDDDVQAIVQSLADLKGEHRLSGICIVGMPGVGKTAVARSIFDIEKARVEPEKRYSLVARVSLSERFDESVILSHMLQYLGISAGAFSNIGAMELRLNTQLENKKFLLILDDVWDVDEKKWDAFMVKLEGILDGVGNSSVVVTTNSKLIASIVEKKKNVHMLRHELQRLSVEECWGIIEKIVGEEAVTPVLYRIGLEIADQCGGLPLVASTIGRYLGEHVSENEWLAVKNNKRWDSPCRNGILSELGRTSYDRLPSHLKKCFAFCSIFPEGIEIFRDELVQLWLAKVYLDGPVAGVRDEKSENRPEDVGNSYFNYLVSTYLFDVVETDEFGEPKSCKMRDEVHNLALLVSDHETYICSDNNPIENIPVASNVRHVRVVPGTNLKAIRKKPFTRLYTLFLEVDVADFHSKVEDLKHLRSLKVVKRQQNGLFDSLSWPKKEKGLFNSVKKSKHVKYLDMSGSGVKVESAVTNFHSLQTLRCLGCKSLKNLSSNVLKKLDRLRHIHCGENDMPSRIEQLTSLQRLPLFAVERRGEDCNIKKLNCLNQLRELKICNLEQVHIFNTTEAPLIEKVNLLYLHLVWSSKRTNKHEDEGLLEYLRPSPNLKSLILENYGGTSFPLWMQNNAHLASLVKLHIKNCPELQTWQMSGSKSLKLSKVSIHSCPNLRALPDMLKINSLDIENCPNLSGYDEIQIDEIIIDGQVVRRQP